MEPSILEGWSIKTNDLKLKDTTFKFSSNFVD